MSVPYKSLSLFYNDIILDESYERFIDFLYAKLNSQVTVKRGLDVGCGSGIFTRKLAKNGYAVTGVDISEDMLLKAESLTRKERLNAKYLKGDMRTLKSLEKVGFISVVNDGLNYIEPKDVKRTFTAFNKCLLKGGILMFDVSSTYKLKNVLGGNMYGDDGEDLSYIWLSSYDDDNKVLDINVSFFKKSGNLYERYDESQRQYAHEKSELLSTLSECGFKVLETFDENDSAIKDDSQRIIILATKI